MFILLVLRIIRAQRCLLYPKCFFVQVIDDLLPFFLHDLLSTSWLTHSPISHIRLFELVNSLFSYKVFLDCFLQVCYVLLMSLLLKSCLGLKLRLMYICQRDVIAGLLLQIIWNFQKSIHLSKQLSLFFLDLLFTLVQRMFNVVLPNQGTSLT